MTHSSYPTISRRETEVLELISQGKTTKEIAQDLYISKETVSSHRRNLLQKWRAENTARLVSIGYESGVLQLPKLN